MDSKQPRQTVATAAKTFRTGLNLTYDLTSRLNSKAGVYYHHDENQADGVSCNHSTGSQDSFDLTLGLSYTINKHFALHADYNHTTQSSLGANTGLLAESLFRRTDLYLLRIYRRDSSAHGSSPGQRSTITLRRQPKKHLGNALFTKRSCCSRNHRSRANRARLRIHPAES